MSTTRRRRAGTALAAVLAAFALALAGTTAAQAETIDPSQQGQASLTIHKRDATPGDPGDGTVLDPAPGNGVNGVGFTLFRVYYDDGGGAAPIDLGTNEGQVLAAQANANWTAGGGSLTAPFSVEEVTTGTTGTVSGEDGVLSFDELEFGLYLVDESTTPPGIPAADPFLVTVPFSTGSEWLYDVHVYPKNALPEDPTKTVEDADVAQIGDAVTWTITAQLDAAPYDSFVVTDQLDPLLDYAADTETVTVAGVTLDAGTDYTFTEADGLLTWTFLSPDGLDALNAAAGNLLIITFQTTINGTGVISNTANVNDVDTTPPDGPGGGGATVKFGGITVAKTDAATDAPLDGAVFEVWLDANGDGELTGEPDDRRLVNPDSGDGNWTTVDGEVVIDGLRFSGFANGAPVADSNDDSVVNFEDDGFNQYFLKEVTAPAGYSLLAEAIPFQVEDETATAPLPVENMKLNAGFELPLTGGAGIAFFSALGVLLIGGAAAFYLLVVARRRREDEAAAARRGAIAG